MIRTIIKFRDDISEDKRDEDKKQIEEAFKNSEGKIENVSADPKMMIFEGTEDYRPCLELGVLKFRRDRDFLDNTDSWIWIDEENPDEEYNILELFYKRLGVPGKGVSKTKRTILTFKEGISEDRLMELRKKVDAAFVNRAGSLKNLSDDPNVMIFEDETEACLSLGYLTFYRDREFLNTLESWEWIDDESPCDNGSILETFLKRLEKSNGKK